MYDRFVAETQRLTGVLGHTFLPMLLLHYESRTQRLASGLGRGALLMLLLYTVSTMLHKKLLATTPSRLRKTVGCYSA